MTLARRRALLLCANGSLRETALVGALRIEARSPRHLSIPSFRKSFGRVGTSQLLLRLARHGKAEIDKVDNGNGADQISGVDLRFVEDWSYRLLRFLNKSESCRRSKNCSRTLTRECRRWSERERIFVATERVS